MINRFISTEKGMRIIEAQNTLVLEVDRRAKKPALKKEIDRYIFVSVNLVLKKNNVCL